MSLPTNITPEILAPVGTLNAAYAAISAGANAIYIGLPKYNARGRSIDHSVEQLKEIIELCHLYGLKVYLAVNILIFENEISDLIHSIKEILPLRPDALIVQDLGIAKLLGELIPGLALHGSTQMTTTSAEAIDLISDIPFKRFVLARENSLKEIRQIRENTDKELEVFVHGALCVAYSGQCLTSESINGRSANRGQCAQSCRLSYTMTVDGEKKDLGNQSYLLSPLDLSAMNEVDELKKIGVNSFKIEGRLKGPDYVGQNTASYKKLVEQTSTPASMVDSFTHNSALTYSRGFYSGWLHGVNHQRLAPATHSAHTGIFLGPIKKIEQGLITLISKEDIQSGDGLRIERAKKQGPADEVAGAIVTFVQKNSTEELQLRIKFNNQTVLQQLQLGDNVFLNSRSTLSQKWEKLDLDQLEQLIEINLTLTFTETGELQIKVIDNNGLLLVKDFGPYKSSHSPLDHNFVEQQFTKTGRTPFFIKSLKIAGPTHFFLNEKMLKIIKRELFSSIVASRLNRFPEQKMKDETFKFFATPTNITTGKVPPKITFLLRSFEQIKGFVELVEQRPELRQWIATVAVDLEYGSKVGAAVDLIKSYGINSGVATTRIFKTGENYNFKQILRAHPDSIIVRNLGAIKWLKEHHYSGQMIGDFSLNATNSLSAHYLMQKGLHRLMAGVDLNATQLFGLLQHFPATQLELPLQWYLSSFHMEHCVFAAYLSEGKDFRDCGRPCEKHQVQLTDQFGHTHYLKADHECRNTLYNAQAQTGLGLLDQFQNIGGQFLRLEFLHEGHELLQEKIISYVNFLSGDINRDELLHLLGPLESFGIGQGQFHRQDKYIGRKQQNPLHGNK